MHGVQRLRVTADRVSLEGNTLDAALPLEVFERAMSLQDLTILEVSVKRRGQIRTVYLITPAKPQRNRPWHRTGTAASYAAEFRVWAEGPDAGRYEGLGFVERFSGLAMVYGWNTNAWWCPQIQAMFTLDRDVAHWLVVQLILPDAASQDRHPGLRARLRRHGLRRRHSDHTAA